MMLFLAIVSTIIAIAIWLAISFANGMSDAPEDNGLSYGGVYFCAASALALWICWWFGWHPSW